MDEVLDSSPVIELWPAALPAEPPTSCTYLLHTRSPQSRRSVRAPGNDDWSGHSQLNGGVQAF